MKHFQLLIGGRVQGVSYRASAQAVARRLGLRGYARNLPDGNVLIEVEGTDERALDEFERWCRQGPPGARVDFAQRQAGNPANYPDFRILY